MKLLCKTTIQILKQETSLSFTYVNMEANKAVHWPGSHCVQFTPPWSYLLHRTKGAFNAVKCNFFTSPPAARTGTHFNLERPKHLHQLHSDTGNSEHARASFK